MTLAVVASCTKTEISYDLPDQISFAPVAKVSTKAAVQGEYPNLPILVYANAGEGTTFTDSYLDDVQFENTDTDNINAWVNETAYWPNEKSLIFSGVSKLSNVSANNVSMDFTTGKQLTITGYNQLDSGDNDLMWFPITEPQRPQSTALSIEMKHACAWLVFNFKGNDVTASSTSPWKVTKVVVKNIYKTGTANLGITASWPTANLSNNVDYVVYNDYPQDATATTVVYNENGKGKSLTTSGVDISNNDNVIVIPQNINETNGLLEITYEFKSQANTIIKEVKTVSLAPTSTDSAWAAGKKYTYDVIITTQQIMISPTVAGWDQYDAVPDVDGDDATTGIQNPTQTIS